MPEDAKGFKTNARAVWDAYVFCNQLIKNNDLLDLVGSYLPHGQYVVYEIQSKLFIAVKEHLHDVPPADPNQTVKVALPQKYQEDLAILYTLAIRLNTLEKGTGACFHFSREHIDAMAFFLSDTALRKQIAPRHTEDLDLLLKNIQKGCKKTEGIILGPENGSEHPDYPCDPEIMQSLYGAWLWLHNFGRSFENDDTWKKLPEEQQDDILFKGPFGGNLPEDWQTKEHPFLALAAAGPESMTQISAAMNQNGGNGRSA